MCPDTECTRVLALPPILHDPPVPALRIVLLCLCAAVLYGILHDQVTARVCVEYFTVGHPPVFGTESPTLLAFGWGVLATWWVGVLLGLLLAFAGRRGPAPPRTARSLVRPVGVLLLVMALVAAAAGGLGYGLGRAGAVVLLEPFASRVPAERHALFLADLWAHSASYLVGFVGGGVLAARVWRARQREARRLRLVAAPAGAAASSLPPPPLPRTAPTADSTERRLVQFVLVAASVFVGMTCWAFVGWLVNVGAVRNPERFYVGDVGFRVFLGGGLPTSALLAVLLLRWYRRRG